jgi:hypothetical protein
MHATAIMVTTDESLVDWFVGSLIYDAFSVIRLYNVELYFVRGTGLLAE